MKKIATLLVLVISIAGKVCAQNKVTLTNTDKTFEPPLNSITRRYTIDLGKGNKMQLEMSDISNINHLKNIDSLVKVFLHDLEPLKDSLSNELLSKRIDYVTDSMGRKKIRFQQYPPKGSSFLVTQGEVAALKVEQDTIFISGIVPGDSREVLSKKGMVSNYYRIGFFVNQLTELPAYLDGRLNEKMNTVQKSDNEKWSTQKDDNWYIRNGDPSIYSKQPKGYFSGFGDYLELNAGINLQNYKNYFVPSFTLKASVYVNDERYKNQIGFAWEPHFLFAKNSQGNLQAFRNDFITLLLGREPLKNRLTGNNDPHFNLFQHLSIGYLVRQKGDFYDDHTFRLGTGAAEWDNGKIKLEPLLYFHDFFKGVTPGLRLSLNF
jgi:hypothetical protein